MLAARALMAASNGAAPFNDNLLPWIVNVDVFQTPVSQVTWNSLLIDSNSIYTGLLQSTGAQNAEINFDVVLAAGTWTIELIHVKAATAGIYTIQFDGVSVGTVDAYASATTYNVRTPVVGVTVAATGKKRLKLWIATKNASSTNYLGMLHHIQFKRTA